MITSTGSVRGKKPIYLKQIADDGIKIAAKQGFQVLNPHFPFHNEDKESRSKQTMN